MVLTHTDLWYVPAYFCLMIISPMLNAGMDALTKRMFTIALLPVYRCKHMGEDGGGEEASTQRDTL